MWHYQIGKYVSDGKEYYGVFEVIEHEGKTGWTEDPVAFPYSESKEDIIQQLQYMLNDCTNLDVFDQ